MDFVSSFSVISVFSVVDCSVAADGYFSTSIRLVAKQLQLQSGCRRNRSRRQSPAGPEPASWGFSPSSRLPPTLSRPADTRSLPAMRPSMTTFATLAEPRRSAISDTGTQTTRACFALKPSGTLGAVIKNQSSGSYAGSEFVKRQLIHGDQYFRLRNQRRCRCDRATALHGSARCHCASQVRTTAAS